MPKIIVTGGSGKAGRACIQDLLAHGYEVYNIDSVIPARELCPGMQADLSDFGQTLDALHSRDAMPHGVDGVVHLAAIPAPRRFPNPELFRNNTLSIYNVFEAARRMGIKNVVWASSETVLGLPFDAPPPYVPLDEEYPGRPESAYSLSKLLGEEMARQFCRWDPELKIVSLRFSNILDNTDYAHFKNFQDKPMERKWNLWGYIDSRDAAQAVRKALEAKFKGAEVFIIANNDTVMDRPNAELLAQVFPGVPVKAPFGPHDTLLSIEKAKRMLGFKPEFTWRKP